jgi:hypothetical protein
MLCCMQELWVEVHWDNGKRNLYRNYRGCEDVIVSGLPVPRSSVPEPPSSVPAPPPPPPPPPPPFPSSSSGMSATGGPHHPATMAPPSGSWTLPESFSMPTACLTSSLHCRFDTNTSRPCEWIVDGLFVRCDGELPSPIILQSAESTDVAPILEWSIANLGSTVDVQLGVVRAGSKGSHGFVGTYNRFHRGIGRCLESDGIPSFTLGVTARVKANYGTKRLTVEMLNRGEVISIEHHAIPFSDPFHLAVVVSHGNSLMLQSLSTFPFPSGTKVVRGPEWKWHDQDGTPGSMGTADADSAMEGWVSVTWLSGGKFNYRFHRGVFDVIPFHGYM